MRGRREGNCRKRVVAFLSSKRHRRRRNSPPSRKKTKTSPGQDLRPAVEKELKYSRRILRRDRRALTGIYIGISRGIRFRVWIKILNIDVSISLSLSFHPLRSKVQRTFYNAIGGRKKCSLEAQWRTIVYQCLPRLHLFKCY